MFPGSVTHQVAAILLLARLNAQQEQPHRHVQGSATRAGELVAQQTSLRGHCGLHSLRLPSKCSPEETAAM